jgi:hypothetical protein
MLQSGSVDQGQASPIPSQELAPASSPLHVLNSYVSFSEDGYTLNAPASVLEEIPSDLLGQLRDYIAQVNGNIKSGSLAMSPEGVALPTAAVLSRAAAMSGHAIPFNTGRHGYIKAHWYGIEVGLDAWLTNKVEGAAWTGSGVSALAALLGGGPYAAPVSGALAVAAGGIQVCQHQDGWTILYWLGAIAPWAYACNPFG